MSNIYEQPFRRPDYFEYMNDPNFGNVPRNFQSNYDRISINERMTRPESFKNEIYTPNDIRRSAYNMPYGYDYNSQYQDERLFTNTNMEGMGSNYNSIGKSYNWYGDTTYNPEVETMTPERCESRYMICSTLPKDDQWRCKNYVRRTGCDFYMPGGVPVPSVGRWGGIPYNQNAAIEQRQQRWTLQGTPRIDNGLPAAPIQRPASLREPERFHRGIPHQTKRETMVFGDTSSMTPKCYGLNNRDCVRPKHRQ